MSCDVGELTERLDNEQSSAVYLKNLKALRILQPFRHFTYITAHSPTFRRFTYITANSAHSPTFLSLYLHHNSFSNPSVALPTSEIILQPFRCFTYITAHSPTLPLLHLRHSTFSNPSFASTKSQALHLIHLASRPCIV